MTGSDLRRYRKTIGLNQRAFAERVGIAQATLSLMETGRLGISEEHLARLRAAFDAPSSRPGLSDFLRDAERRRAQSQGALAGRLSAYRTLPVWGWTDQFDLSEAPEQVLALVTVAAAQCAVALYMPKPGLHWARGEIMVFERCGPQDLKDGSLCLVQRKKARGSGAQTFLAVASVTPATPGHLLQLKPLAPSSGIFTLDESVLACLRLIHRAQNIAE